MGIMPARVRVSLLLEISIATRRSVGLSLRTVDGGDDFNQRTIGGLQVPPDLERFVSADGTPPGSGLNSGRDGNNNIIIYFGGHGDERPSDGAPCWMYVERFGSWVSGTQN